MTSSISSSTTLSLPMDGISSVRSSIFRRRSFISASDTARFSHPELSFGDVVYGPLHDLVGASVARDLCLTGRVMEAAEALRIGFVSAVVPGEELSGQATGTADAIARAPRDVLLRTKAKFTRRAGVVSGKTLDL